MVPPGKGWTRDPYGAETEGGAMFGRVTAVSKSEFASFTCARLSLSVHSLPGRSSFTSPMTRKSGGELGPGRLLREVLTQTDLLIAAGFAYKVITAGWTQIEVTFRNEQAHDASLHTSIDTLQGIVTTLKALYALNDGYRKVHSQVSGINHPYLNIGHIVGGTNTNVVPGKVTFTLERRMIPEEDPVIIEAENQRVIAAATTGVTVDLRRLLLAKAMSSAPGNQTLVDAIQRHSSLVSGQPVPATGTSLYTDVRLYAEAGVTGVIHGAGPRTVLESHAKRADERLQLEDLRFTNKVVARTPFDLLQTA